MTPCCDDGVCMTLGLELVTWELVQLYMQKFTETVGSVGARLAAGTVDSLWSSEGLEGSRNGCFGG